MSPLRSLAMLALLPVAGPFLGPAAPDFSTMRGANYVPSYARNDVAIWMDYDQAVVERELGYARRLGLNTVRIFLNERVYARDPRRFVAQLEGFLGACGRLGLQAMPVLFDSCFDPQDVDLEGYRSRDWMPSPGYARLGLADRAAMGRYVAAVVGRHRADRRIVVWDVMNEPESTAHYGDVAGEGRRRIHDFVRWALARVKAERPTQPLTVGWAGFWANLAAVDLVDVLCLHCYAPADDLARHIREAQEIGRIHRKPVIMNEFAAQPHQPLERAIPVAASCRIGWVFWELMIGKSQFTQGSAPYQGHIYPDGTCRSVREVASILHPEGHIGDARRTALAAGFRPRTVTQEGITFEGAWQRWTGAGPTGGRLWHAGNADDSATREVEGTEVSVVLKHGADCGVAGVVVDGRTADVAEIDTYSPEVSWNVRTVVARGLAPGRHAVTVCATGRKSPQSSFRYVQVVDLAGRP